MMPPEGGDVPFPEGGRMPMLSWLERTLLEERQVLESVLAVKHRALLREISPYLQGVEWKASCTKEVPGLTPPCGNPKHVQNVDSQSTPPSSSMADKERGQHVSSTEGRDTESDEVPPSPTPSDGLGASGRSNSHEQHKARRLTLTPWTGGELNLSKDVLQDTLELHADDPGGEKANGFFARLGRFVRSATFESVFALLILTNTLMMATESQYEGIDIGWKVGYSGSSSRASDTWPGATDIFKVAEWIFGVLFTIELLLKIAVLGKTFCSDTWNFLDTIIVISWFLTVITLFPMPIDPMLLRLARLARLLRLLKLIKKIRLFDSLYLLTTAMRGSFAVLLWSVVVLGLVQMLLSLFLQSLLEIYMVDEQKPKAERLQVFKFYGTFARSMLTMFEITLGNWMPPCRALVENVSEWWMLFFIAHKMIIGFSVVTVITSVFIQETFKVATIDDRIMIMTKERARKTHIQKINALFGHADRDGNGFIDIEELTGALADSGLRTWLEAMDLKVHDSFQLFNLLDADGDGQLKVKELVDGIARLKGTATSYDLVSVEKCNMNLMKDLQLVQNQLKRIEDRLLLSHQCGCSGSFCTEFKSL